MNLKQLKLLDENKEYHILVTNGVCVGERTTDTCEVLLFQVNNTYVEVFFSLENDRIYYTYHFTDTEFLEPYLQQIDCSDVW